MSIVQFTLVALVGIVLIVLGSRRISTPNSPDVLLVFRRWLAKKLGLPSPEARLKLLKDWNYRQANDWEILDGDPEKDRVTEAVVGLDSGPEPAFQTLLGLAERGSVWSMVQVGWCYHAGRGVVADVAQAEGWYRRAFEGGSERALLHYASFQWARGDFDKCEAIYGVGAANGWAPAQYWLARARFRKSHTRATLRRVRPLLESAVEKGSPAAKWFLGYYMFWGWFGLRQVVPGFKLTWEFMIETSKVLDAMKAAEGGSASAQYYMGWIYAFGGGLAHSDTKALDLFNLSAAQGNANAMLAKGWMYAHGRGAAYDAVQAYVWPALAAALLPETDTESREMAVEYRDWARSHLSKAQVARAARMIKKERPSGASVGRTKP